jgi:hypothetical protein
MKIRINDLARELEVKSKVILDILPEVGVIEKKTYSSSIKEYEAERVRKHFSARSGSSSREKTSSLGSKPKIDLSKISKPGDVARLLREREEESRRNLAAQRGAQPPAEEPSIPSAPAMGSPSSTMATYAVSENAQRVLNLASQIRSGTAAKTQPSSLLTCRSVCFALVDFGPIAPGTGAGALHKAINDSKQMYERYAALRKNYSPPQHDPLNVPPLRAATRLSDNLSIIFKRALALAQATAHSNQIGLRHLTAAFLLEGPKLKTSKLGTLLETIALDIDSFLYHMYVDMQKNLPLEDMQAWESALFSSGPRDIPGYSADSDRGEDFLQVKDDVEPFAAVIAAQDLLPPLSIGLFGDWGSGKSFFMRTLRERIDQIADGAREINSKIFCSQIIQISFNAWFYVDHSLWATLVSEIFDKLFSGIKERMKKDTTLTPAEVKKQIQGELEKAQGLFKEAQKELDDAQSGLTQAQTRLTALIQDRQKKEQTLSESLNDLGSLLAGNDQMKRNLGNIQQQLGLPETTRSFQALEEQLGQAQTLGRRLATMLVAVFQPPGVLLRILALIAVFLVPILVAVTISELASTKGFHDVVMMVASAGSFAVTAATWIGRQVQRGTRLTTEAESVFGQLKAIREKRIHQDTALQRAELQQLEEREAVARKQVTETEVRVQTLQRELAEMQPGARLQKFIRDRSASTDYSKHLGLVSLIRKDFETLSDMLENREDIPVQRIVLYIDDLDRCPPNRVVEVLEAIHLLLAFRLFVVVVGVDARWVIGSLQREYRGLLADVVNKSARGADVATPHDYLEKIFQIPFWIYPMTETGSKEMIAGLLPIHKESAEDNPNVKIDQAKENSISNQPSSTERESNDSGNADPNSGDRRQSKQKPGSQIAPPTKSTDPGKLILKDFELEYIQELAPCIGRSPRRLKRFVNIYRLLRASIRPGADAVSFIGTRESPGEHRVALVLLAVLTGAPTLAPEIMKILREAPTIASITNLREQIATRLQGCDAAELEAAIRAFEFLTTKTRHENLQHLQKWEPVLARYSFRPRDNSSLWLQVLRESV